MSRNLRVESRVWRHLMYKAILLLAVFGLAGALCAADLFVGTWKIDLAKSRTSYPLEGIFTTKVEAQDDGIRVVENLVWANGDAVQRRFAAKYDGKDYPVEGDPTMDAISLQMPNPDTINYVVKKGGKQFAGGRWVVSRDRTTSTSTGTAKVGDQVFTYEIFLEKQ